MSSAGQINLVYLVGALVLVGLSIPLLLGKIGPNGLYGYRTAKTQSDPKIWYAVNKALGKGLLVGGVVILLTTIGIAVAGADLGMGLVIGVDLAMTVVALGGAIGYASSTLRTQ